MGNLFKKYSSTDIIHVAITENVHLSPELLHEIVSSMCLRFPISKETYSSTLPQSSVYCLPSSFLLEYGLQKTNVKDVISKIADLSHRKKLRSLFFHAILRLRSARRLGDSFEKIMLSGSILISVITSAAKFNYIKEFMDCTVWKNLLSLAFDDNVYQNLLKKDVFTLSMFQIIPKILQIQNLNIQESLQNSIVSVKTQFLGEVGPSFPTDADTEILNLFKFVPNFVIHFEIFNETVSKVGFDQFCWILETVLTQQVSDVFPARYLTLIIEQCVESPSKKYFRLLEKIFNTQAELSMQFPRIESSKSNQFGTKIFNIGQDLVETFFPILAKNVSGDVESIIRYFTKYYPFSIKFFVREINFEELNVHARLVLLESIMDACCIMDNSCRWKDGVDIEVKASMLQLWKLSQNYVSTEMKHTLLGRKEYKKCLYFIGSSCSSLLMKNSKLLEDILEGIPTMTCSSQTLMILTNMFAQLKELCGSQKDKKSLLAIILRILRGYLIFMKDKESVIGVEFVTRELKDLSNDLTSTALDHSDDIDADLMKYARNFAITVLKSYFDNPFLISSIEVLWCLSLKSKVFFDIFLKASTICFLPTNFWKCK